MGPSQHFRLTHRYNIYLHIHLYILFQLTCKHTEPKDGTDYFGYHRKEGTMMEISHVVDFVPYDDAVFDFSALVETASLELSKLRI